LHRFFLEEKSIAWNQQNAFIKGVEQPQEKFMQTFNSWRVNHHLPLEKGPSFLSTT